MAKLGTIIADFRTALAAKMAVGATTGTLQSAIDDDGVALPTGRLLSGRYWQKTEEQPLLFSPLKGKTTVGSYYR